MTSEEIFSHLSSHMIKGLMIHDQLASAYKFLNLCGYSKCHEYHYFEESRTYRCLQNTAWELRFRLSGIPVRLLPHCQKDGCQSSRDGRDR